jgi:hypothetical protein
MKNRSVLLALVLGIGLFTTSCSDDNEGETLAPLSGKWNISQVQNEAGCSKDYLDLNVDNTLTEGNYDSTIDPCALSVTPGIYSRSHNNLTTVVNGVTQVQDIVNLTLTELKLKDANGAIEVYVKN